MSRRRSFGAVRPLPSGRWQARYPTEDGRTRKAPTTFASRVDAERFLAQLDIDRARGGAIDPDAGAIALADYADQWLVERPVALRPRTLELYEGLLRLRLLPTFGSVHLNRITSAAVRSWHAGLRRSGVGESTVAKAYRLLKGVLNAAVEDDLLARNPCRIRHAGAERPDERRPPSLAEVEAIAGSIEPRFRALVLLGAWSGLRYGELAGLTRQRIDPLHGAVDVREQLIQTKDGRRFLAAPKTSAGVRTVVLPPHLLPEIEAHLEAFVDASPTAMVFTGAKSATLERSNFRNVWLAASSRRSALRFHDLPRRASPRQSGFEVERARCRRRTVRGRRIRSHCPRPLRRSTASAEFGRARPQTGLPRSRHSGYLVALGLGRLRHDLAGLRRGTTVRRRPRVNGAACGWSDAPT